MQYKYCSLREVVGSVIRNTGLQDAGQVSNIHEWLYEAMELYPYHALMANDVQQVQIRYHKGELPCELVSIEGVSYCGRRLMEGGNQANLGLRQYIENDKRQRQEKISFYTNVVKIEQVPGRINYYDAIKAVWDGPVDASQWYFTDMGSINTSFAEGVVTIYGKIHQIDEDGMPRIPDNRNYKLALYYYCRAMMIGAGFQDKVMSFEHCMQMHELHGARASGEILMPSPEQMEHRLNTFTRLLPHSGYYDTFFNTTQPESEYYI